LKKILVLAVLALAAWVAWTRFQPLSLEGDVVPEATRVVTVSGDLSFDPADKLERGTWTLVLFTSRETEEERTLARQLEVVVRKERPTVRLVIVELRGLDSPAALQHGIQELPTLWLYEGYRQVTKRRADIERAIFGG
jgi:hypothetical protein